MHGQPDVAPDSTRARAGLRARWARWTELGADGRPRLRVLLAFPLAVVLIATILVALGVNGSSSGAYRAEFERGADPALLAGHPQAIRSDEWKVNAPLTIAQVELGLPVESTSLVGGQDAGIPQDLPRADWTIAFRPHLIGFLFLDLDRAVAWRWWLPEALVLVLAYLLAMTVLPRRPVLSALAAIGLTFSPFFQWWFLSMTFTPVAWALAVVATLLGAVRGGPRIGRWAWAAACGYLTVVMAMGVYLPYIIPVAVVGVAVGVGVVVTSLRDGMRPLRLVGALLPLAIAGAAGTLVTVVWLRSKQAVVDGLTSTVYPGERLTPTGSGGVVGAARTVSSSFTEALERGGGFLGNNSSEASTFFLLGAFAVPTVVWLVVRRRRLRDRQPVVLIAATAAVLLLAAFVLVPGWDPIAHLLFLDRTTDTRARIGLGLGSFVVMLLLVRELAGTRMTRPGRIVAVASSVLFLGSQLAVAAVVIREKGLDELTRIAPFWWLLALASAAAVVLLGLRRALPAVAITAAFSLVTSALVNPLYVGIYDLRSSPASQLVQRIDDADPGAWVPLGEDAVTALLIESGVTSYSGVQGDPPEELWEGIDPDHRYEAEWNRLANIAFAPGDGDPVVTNPAPDRILVTFDACADFAQRHVRWVASAVDTESPCLELVDRTPLAEGELEVFEVVPRGAGG